MQGENCVNESDKIFDREAWKQESQADKAKREKQEQEKMEEARERFRRLALTTVDIPGGFGFALSVQETQSEKAEKYSREK